MTEYNGENRYMVYANLSVEEEEEVKDFIADTRSINNISLPKSATLGAILLAAVRNPKTKAQAQQYLRERVNA